MHTQLITIPARFPPAEPSLLSGLTAEPSVAYGGAGCPAGGMLAQITDFLVAELKPDKIFLTDGYFREAQEHPDLLIVIPDSSDMPFDAYHLGIAGGYPDGLPFTYSLHLWHDVYRYILEGHIFYSVVCIPANLLYDSGGGRLPLSLQARAEAIRDQARQAFYKGLAKGEAFLDSARHAYGRDDTGITAFLLQQAVEIPLRSLLQALTGQDLHTHSISKLSGCCRRCAPQLASFFPDPEDGGKRLLTLLDEAYIYGRYRDHFLPKKTDLLLLFEKAKALHMAMRELFEEKLTIFGA